MQQSPVDPPSSRPSLSSREPVQQGPIPLFDYHLTILNDSYLNFFLERSVTSTPSFPILTLNTRMKEKDRGDLVCHAVTSCGLHLMYLQRRISAEIASQSQSRRHLVRRSNRNHDALCLGGGARQYRSRCAWQQSSMHASDCA